MQPVTEQVDAAYLKLPPPRPIFPALVVNVLSDHIFAQPLRSLLSPLAIGGVLALVALFALGASPALRLIPAAVILAHLASVGRQIWRRTRDDLALLHSGLAVRAHVIKLRPHRTTTGEIDGARLECAIPVAPRRTYMGSIWLADGAEALRLSRQGRVEVLCLPRAPGTWRLIEEVNSEVRYDRMGPMQALPSEV